METKNIAITDDAYNLLKKRKKENESFSDVIRRITKKENIMKFAGAWSYMPDSEIKKIKRNISKLRNH